MGLDGLVAKGIYLGLGISSPTYEEVGEAFLRDILPDYTRGTYGTNIVRAMLKGLTSERLEKICQGVEDILDKGNSEIKEAKLIMLANKCYRLTDSFEDRGSASSLSNLSISFLLEHAEKTSDYVIEESIMRRLEERNRNPKTIHRQKNSWKLECLSILDFTLEYFMNHANEIPSEFIDYFPLY